MKVYKKLLEFLEKRARYSSLLILSELKNVIPTIKSMKNILDSEKLEGTGSEQGFTDTSFAWTVQLENGRFVKLNDLCNKKGYSLKSGRSLDPKWSAF